MITYIASKKAHVISMYCCTILVAEEVLNERLISYLLHMAMDSFLLNKYRPALGIEDKFDEKYM